MCKLTGMQLPGSRTFYSATQLPFLLSEEVKYMHFDRSKMNAAEYMAELESRVRRFLENFVNGDPAKVAKVTMWRHAKIHFLDEYQDMNSEVYAFFDMFLRIVREDRATPLGGLMNIFAGDCLQHIQMNKTKFQIDNEIMRMTSGFYDESQFSICITNQEMLNTFDICLLEAANHRTSNSEWQAILLRIRRAEVTDEDLENMNSLFTPSALDSLFATVTDAVAFSRHECKVTDTISTCQDASKCDDYSYKVKREYILSDRLQGAIKLINATSNWLRQSDNKSLLSTGLRGDLFSESLLAYANKIYPSLKIPKSLYLCTETSQMQAFGIVIRNMSKANESSNKIALHFAKYRFGYIDTLTGKLETPISEKRKIPVEAKIRADLPNWLLHFIPSIADNKQPEVLEIVVGEKYSITTNMYAPLSNGQICDIERIESNSLGIQSLILQAEDPSNKSRNFISKSIKPYEHIYPIFDSPFASSASHLQFAVQVQQFGIKSGTVRTVQSVTGLTLNDNYVINNTKSMPPGLFYQAVARASNPALITVLHKIVSSFDIQAPKVSLSFENAILLFKSSNVGKTSALIHKGTFQYDTKTKTFMIKEYS
jgi:hypothetical protein